MSLINRNLNNCVVLKCYTKNFIEYYFVINIVGDNRLISDYSTVEVL